MLRSEVGTGDGNRDGSKASGSDITGLDLDKKVTGNGLAKEFSDTVVANAKQAIPSTGPLDAESGERMQTVQKGSSTGEKAAEVAGKENKPQANGEGTGMRAEAASAVENFQPNGAAKKSAADGISGSGQYKTTGIGDAFPSSTELLKGLKA